MDKLTLYIESLIFASQDPIPLEDIHNTLEVALDQKIEEELLINSINELKEKYADDAYSFELVGISKGWHFMTKGAYHPVISHYLKLQSKKRLSRSALETLAIIAYKQPITKASIEQIRGVNCDYAVQKLVEKELVEIEGRAEGPGRPLLYGTSMKFLNHFGIQELTDLPKLKEINVEVESNNFNLPIPDENILTNENSEEKESTEIDGNENIEIAEDGNLEEALPNSENEPVNEIESNLSQQNADISPEDSDSMVVENDNAILKNVVVEQAIPETTEENENELSSLIVNSEEE